MVIGRGGMQIEILGEGGISVQRERGLTLPGRKLQGALEKVSGPRIQSFFFDPILSLPLN